MLEGADLVGKGRDEGVRNIWGRFGWAFRQDMDKPEVSEEEEFDTRRGVEHDWEHCEKEEKTQGGKTRLG